jgi:RimJ/RimL family protein N-acetyltransferase
MSLFNFIFFAACSFYKTDTSALKVLIETHRLSIESYQSSHVSKSISLYSDPIITRYYDTGKPKPLYKILSFVQSSGIETFEKGEPFGLFSIFKKATHDFIGHIDLLMVQNNPQVLEIGYILFEQFHGQGFGSEAAYAMIYDYIPRLKSLGYPIEKVIATAHPENIASQKVLKKMGFKFDKKEDRFNQPRLWYSLNLN